MKKYEEMLKTYNVKTHFNIHMKVETQASYTVLTHLYSYTIPEPPDTRKVFRTYFPTRSHSMTTSPKTLASHTQ